MCKGCCLLQLEHTTQTQQAHNTKLSFKKNKAKRGFYQKKTKLNWTVGVYSAAAGVAAAVAVSLASM